MQCWLGVGGGNPNPLSPSVWNPAHNCLVVICVLFVSAHFCYRRYGTQVQAANAKDSDLLTKERLCRALSMFEVVMQRFKGFLLNEHEVWVCGWAWVWCVCMHVYVWCACVHLMCMCASDVHVCIWCACMFVCLVCICVWCVCSFVHVCVGVVCEWASEWVS